MADETTPRQQRPLQTDQRQAVSFLVRFWLEPQEGGGEACECRGYARDLRTGEERYFGNPRSFSEHVERRLQATHQAEDSRFEADQVADAIG